MNTAEQFRLRSYAYREALCSHNLGACTRFALARCGRCNLAFWRCPDCDDKLCPVCTVPQPTSQ